MQVLGWVWAQGLEPALGLGLGLGLVWGPVRAPARKADWAGILPAEQSMKTRHPRRRHRPQGQRWLLR